MSESKSVIEVFKRERRAAKTRPLNERPRNELEKYVFFDVSSPFQAQRRLKNGECMVRVSRDTDPTILTCSCRTNDYSVFHTRMKWITRCDEGYGVWTFVSDVTGESNNTFISKLEHLPDYLKLYHCLDVELITPRHNDAKETGKDVLQFTGIETIRF